MKCPKCGAENPEGSLFCQECGQNIRNENLVRSSSKKMWVIIAITAIFAAVLFVYIKNRNSQGEFNEQLTSTQTNMVDSAREFVLPVQEELEQSLPITQKEPPSKSIAKKKVQTLNADKDEDEDVVFVIVENKPEFPGGDAALMKYIAENIKYPVIALENGIQGRVICQFVVNADGSIVDVVVVKSGGDKSLDKEAIRVIKSMPKWKPGMNRGKPVRVKYTLPINFQI